MNKFSKYIAEIETDINEKLFKRHLAFQRPSDIFNSLNNIDDTEKNSKLVDVIISGLKDLKKLKRCLKKKKKMKSQMR